MRRTSDDLRVSDKHKRQLERAVKRQSNELADKVLFPTFDNSSTAFPHMFAKEVGSFLHHDMDRLSEAYEHDLLDGDRSSFQEAVVLFTNPLDEGEYDPKKRVPGQHSGGTPPSERVANGGWVILTYEVDATTIADLEVQLDWFAGKPEKCEFSKVHKALASWADYRGYSAIFSGNKSLHVHIVFDTVHLTKALQGAARRKNKLWKFDVSGAQLAALHQLAWTEVAAIIQDSLNSTAVFDRRLSSYVQKRRSPWGIRTLANGSPLHQFDAGDQIQQIVLQERISERSLAPRNAPALFDAKNILSVKEVTRTADHLPSAKRVLTANAATVLAELEVYLRSNGWGAYPKPVDICYDGEFNCVFFQNDAGDVYPSSLIRGDYRQLLGAGRGAPTIPLFLPNELTLDQTLELLPSFVEAHRTAASATNSLPTVGKPLIRSVDVHSARTLAGPPLLSAARRQGPTLVQGPEGLGKTHGLMSSAIDLLLDDLADYGVTHKGFTGFASRSDAQLQEKREEFVTKHSYGARTIVLPSVKSLYLKACLRTDTQQALCNEDAASSGASSFLHMVRSQQPIVYAEMERLRDDVWRLPDGRVHFNPDAFIFLTHALVKVWPHAFMSRGFLHPGCPSDLDPKEMSKCADEMAFRRVIFDEVSWDDLATVISSATFDFAERVKRNCKSASGKVWGEASLAGRVRAYRAETRSGDGISFDECDQLIRLGFTSDDGVTVDANRFSFGKGMDSANIYHGVHGAKFYCKSQRWFWSLKCPVVILTTEDLPRLVARGINDHPLSSRRKKIAVINMTDTPHLHRDIVPLVFDERVRHKRSDKEWADDLATGLLNDHGFDIVLANGLSPENPKWAGAVLSHQTAKGSNVMAGRKVASFLTYPAVEQYAELCALGTAFDIEAPVVAFYRDQVHQCLGRNMGFRYTEGQPFNHHVVFMKSSLFRDLDQFRSDQIPNAGSDRYRFVTASLDALE